jgi:hypothetical protein
MWGKEVSVMKDDLRFPTLRRRKNKPVDHRPCAMCGLAPRIKVHEGMGQFCLYYGIRISDDEANDVDNDIRKICRQDGNHFTWPVVGLKADELLKWHIDHLDHHLQRTTLIWGVVIGVVSLVISLLSVLVDTFITG